MSELRIYAACLASYNAGKPYGDWITVSPASDSWELTVAIGEILKDSPEPGAEEYAIHDYEGFPASLTTNWGEHPDLDEVCNVANALSESGEVFEAALSYLGNAHDALECLREDRYIGCGDSKAEIVEQWLDDTGFFDDMTHKETIRQYFDFEAYARDLRLGGEWFFERVNGTVYAFSNH